MPTVMPPQATRAAAAKTAAAKPRPRRDPWGERIIRSSHITGGAGRARDGTGRQASLFDIEDYEIVAP